MHDNVVEEFPKTFIISQKLNQKHCLPSFGHLKTIQASHFKNDGVWHRLEFHISRWWELITSLLQRLVFERNSK